MKLFYFEQSISIIYNMNILKTICLEYRLTLHISDKNFINYFLDNS
jgi:hypothetical protein